MQHTERLPCRDHMTTLLTLAAFTLSTNEAVLLPLIVCHPAHPHPATSTTTTHPPTQNLPHPAEDLRHTQLHLDMCIMGIEIHFFVHTHTLYAL